MPNAPRVLPGLLFPPRPWWTAALTQPGVVRINTGEPLRNLSYRNRYRIATANGALLLSVPVVGGRRHDAPLDELQSDDRQGWQRRHWRTLFSAYGRAPFFEYFGPELEALILESGISMAERNLKAMRWMARCMRLPLEFQAVVEVPAEAREHYEMLAFGEVPVLKPYHQVFDGRLGFIPDLSALDLLMMQGNRASGML
jgi:hypothetical protein